MNISEKLFDLFMALPPDYAFIERLIRLTNIIRTRLRGRLIGSGIIIVIDRRQPIGFLCFA